MTKTIDEILAVAEDPAFTRVVTARISFVPQALRDEHAELEHRLNVLRDQRDTVDIPREQSEVADRLLAIETEIEESIVEFRFRSVGYRAWADLLRKHPPTKDQLSTDRRLDHNPDTFPYEAMATSCSEPEMTVDQIKQLAGSPLIDVKSWTTLWDACLRANVADEAPKSMAAGLIHRLNGEFSRRHTTTASPAVSSSAE
jgi:hypothetical protein